MAFIKQLKNRQLILFTLALVNFIHIVDSMLIMPLGDIFIKEFQISSGEYSLLVSSYALAAFFSSLIGVFYLDRFDRKTALLFIYLGFGVGTIACAFTDSYAQLVALRVFTGFFGGMIGAMVLSIVSDLYKFKERGAAMGILFAAFSAASALGIPIGIYLAAKSSWHLPFIVIGVIALLIAGFIAVIFPNMTSHLSEQDKEINFKKTVKAITSDPNQLNALLAGFILVLAHFMIIPFISPYLMANVGLTQEEIALQFFCGGVATVISAPLIGRMTDKYGVMKVFSTVMFLSFIPTVLITNLNIVPLWVAISFTTMFFVFASGRMISPNTIITAAASQANRGSFMSIKSALQQLAIGLSSLIAGQVIFIGDDNIFHNYHWVGVISIVFGVFSIFLVRKIKVAKGN
ncbi:MAG: putative MFS family arabinose efflux permease [Saprospiraceae bacterium]|jgi:predicted MFS family arabinose efflux permease